MAVCAKCIFLADGHHPVLLRVYLDGRLATIHLVMKNLIKRMKLTMTNALIRDGILCERRELKKNPNTIRKVEEFCGRNADNFQNVEFT